MKGLSPEAHAFGALPNGDMKRVGGDTCGVADGACCTRVFRELEHTGRLVHTTAETACLAGQAQFARSSLENGWSAHATLVAGKPRTSSHAAELVHKRLDSGAVGIYEWVCAGPPAGRGGKALYVVHYTEKHSHNTVHKQFWHTWLGSRGERTLQIYFVRPGRSLLHMPCA